ncbi:MAG: hypothetical protein KIT31_00735 [Deltaproteobacteria bacterium]|nr:hypothetical protein [Deltaproteobacteria bacterium]
MTFVLTNPRHHADMMVPVARRLRARGAPCRFVSLAELRGLRTPDLGARVAGVKVDRVLPPWVRKSPSAGAGIGEHGGGGALARRIAQEVAWRGVLSPLLRRRLADATVVAVPNDAAFPYGALARQLRARGVPFALLQEGIRFPLPTEQRAGAPYGGGGADAVFVWGEASAEHFRTVARAANVHVTGTPRWDDVDPDAWEERGRALQHRLGLTRRPLLYLSNTIDDQGFCTTAAKMRLFGEFLDRAAPVVAAEGRAIVVKLHGREDVAAFRDVARTPRAAPVHVLGDESLFETLAMGDAAVVLASTVGLEALAFGLPLGVLAIPGHGHVFEYVARGAAAGLTFDNLAHALPPLLATARGPRPETDAFLERHLAHRGRAAEGIANHLLELSTQRSS